MEPHLQWRHCFVDLSRHSLACDGRSDRRAGQGVVNHSPEMLALATWLETPVGHYAACSIMSIVHCVAIILAVVDRPEAAIRMATAGSFFVSSIVTVSLMVCGQSLIRVIDESIELKKSRVNIYGGDIEGAGDQALLAARTKVKWTLGFAARQMVMLIFILGFALFSKYATAAPLLLFDIPLVFMPIIKMMVSVQMFAGRTKLNESGGSRYGTSGNKLSSLAPPRKSTSKMFRKGEVVPTETLSIVEQTLPYEIRDLA